MPLEPKDVESMQGKRAEKVDPYVCLVRSSYPFQILASSETIARVSRSTPAP